MDRQINIILTTGFWLLIFNHSLSGQSLKVKIYNKTGQNIDSLAIGQKYIGNLSKDSVTAFLDFVKFNFDSGVPNEGIFGVIRNEPVQKLNWSKCATMHHSETTGNFVFDLELRENKVEYFVLVPHVD